LVKASRPSYLPNSLSLLPSHDTLLLTKLDTESMVGTMNPLEGNHRPSKVKRSQVSCIEPWVLSDFSWIQLLALVQLGYYVN